jgi:hypothetical protein
MARRDSDNLHGSSMLNRAQGAVLDFDSIKMMPWPDKESGTAAKGTKIKELKLQGVKHLPEIVIYEHIDFGGVSERTNLNWYYVGDWWNDKISSIIVVQGTWRFFEHWHYEGRYWDLEPNYYHWVEAAGIPNDIISSFACIAP